VLLDILQRQAAVVLAEPAGDELAGYCRVLAVAKRYRTVRRAVRGQCAVLAWNWEAEILPAADMLSALG
jgi:hypothetical protein